MTTTAKPITRETLRVVRVAGKMRPLVIEPHGNYLTIRPKGLRAHAYTVPYDAVYELGGKLQAARGLGGREGAAEEAAMSGRAFRATERLLSLIEDLAAEMEGRRGLAWAIVSLLATQLAVLVVLLIGWSRLFLDL